MDAQAADSAARDAVPPDSSAQISRPRFGAFGVFSIGLVALLAAYFMSIGLLEAGLDQEFQARVDRAIIVTKFERPLIQQMKEQIDDATPVYNRLDYVSRKGSCPKRPPSRPNGKSLSLFGCNW